MVDGVRRDQRTVLAAMAAPPRDEPCNVVPGDLGKQHVFAEELDQECKVMLGIVSPGMMLPDLIPVAFGNVVEP
jgi:hypothetical protein